MSNATAAKSWPTHFQYAYSEGGSDAPVTEYKEVVTGAVERGMPLTLSSGKVTEASATSGTLYGIAGADGEIGDEIPVYVGHEDNVFRGQTDGDHSSSNFPKEADLVEVSTEWRINFDATTEGVVQVIGAVPGDDDSDTDDPGRVYFKILRSSYDGRVSAKA